MLNSVSLINEANTSQLEARKQQKQYISFCGTDYERTPDEDTFNGKKNRKAKIVGIIGGLLITIGLVLGGICLHKGGKALGKDAKFGEKLEQGWKELRGKAKPKTEPKPKSGSITWDDVINDSRFTEEQKSQLNKMNDDVKNRIIERNLMSFKYGDGSLADGSDILAFAGFRDETFTKMMDRNLHGIKTKSGEHLSPLEIGELTKLSDTEFSNISKRKLFELTDAENNAFSGFSVCQFAKLSDEVYGNIDKRGLRELKKANGKAFSGYEICRVAEADESEYKNIIDDITYFS